MKRRAVFLDRDGTLITERAYLLDADDMVFYPGVFAALRRLRRLGFRLVVVTNQSAVGRGYLSLADLERINRRFRSMLARHGARIDGIYFCPHLPDAGCACRKPGRALIERAARDLNLDPKTSYVVGDQDRDVKLARNVGATGVLVLTGGGRSVRKRAAPIADKITRNLDTAARWIEKREAC